jgi:hypothetical protein
MSVRISDSLHYIFSASLAVFGIMKHKLIMVCCLVARGPPDWQCQSRQAPPVLRSVCKKLGFTIWMSACNNRSPQLLYCTCIFEPLSRILETQNLLRIYHTSNLEVCFNLFHFINLPVLSEEAELDVSTLLISPPPKHFHYCFTLKHGRQINMLDDHIR